MGMKSRLKGKVGEREASAALNVAFGTECRRGVQYCGGPDSPDVIGMPGVHVEVKRVESLNVRKAMEQSQRDAGAVEIPVVLHRQNRTPWLVTCALSDLPELAKRLAGMLGKVEFENKSRSPGGSDRQPGMTVTNTPKKETAVNSPANLEPNW